MIKVSATEFCRNFGYFQKAVQREPIAVTSHGRPTAYLLSAADYARIEAREAEARQRLRAGERIKQRILALDAGLKAATTRD